MFKKLTCVCVLVLVLGLTASRAVGGVAYSDPPTGWRYIYVGEAAAANLDGTWDHDNGSDEWDGSGMGAGQPGGFAALVDGPEFLRIQDAVTLTSGSSNNRKLYMTHQLTNDGVPTTVADQILSVEGITLSFRARLATTPPLDDLGGSPWPAAGESYGTHDGGKGNFGVHQETGGDRTISFCLSLATDAQDGDITTYMGGKQGLIINSLNGAAPSGDVDATDGSRGTANLLELDPTQWHEFWITIQPDTSGAGTHLVKIWMDGSMVPSEFNVTAGNGGDETYSYLGMGCGSSGQAGALDADFFAYKEGIHLPPGMQKKAYDPVPEDGSRAPPSGEEGGGFWMLMTFTAGDGATTHTAYFNSNFDDVNDRNAAVSLGSPPYPEVFPTGYYVGIDDSGLPEFARTPLDRGITYYWAVDESNGTSTYPGDVWSYTIASDKAWNPTPPDGAQYIKGASVVLAWQMGDVDNVNNNVSYRVYCGTDEAAVAAIATGNTTAPEYKGTVTTETINLTGLDPETEYFWKVNTVLTLKSPPFTQTIIPGDVWQFTTRVFTPVTDDDTLVGWWTFEPDTGNIVFDQSGYDNDGAIVGGSRGPGYIEDAIVLDGVNDYVDCGNSGPLDFSTGDWTVCAWVKTAEQVDTDTIYAKGGDETGGIRYTLALGENGPDGCVTLTTDDNTTKLQAIGSTLINDGNWHHAVGQRLGNTLVVFVDATEDGVNIDVPVGYNLSGTSQHNALIGAISDAGDPSGSTREKFFAGSMDDVRVYNRALSSKEIKVLAGRLSASDPDPANGATDVSRTPTLSWSPGVFVASANGNIVYYSDDLSAVTNRTAPSATLTNPTYAVPGTLDLGTSFYWAVDTVNGVDVWPGDLWRFTTIDWLSVDDMESYVPWTQSGNHIFEKWRDAFGDCTPGNGNNTGSTLTENPDPVWGGIQSMKYEFDNDGTVYSPCTMGQESEHLLYSKVEAQIAGLPSGIGANWTIQGVKALSLRFYGAALNGVEPMWVQLKDGTGYGNKVTYGDYQDEDPNAVTEESWHEWFIDMADFDVDLSNLVSISIGFGNDDGSGSHGSGTIYFDDFRLYTPRCMPSRHTAEQANLDFAPVGAPDCVVNYKELDVMADDWLLGDAFVTAAARPAPDPNLVAWWKFDDGSGTTAIDSSGRASALTLSGAITWEDGISGGAVHFRGVGSGTGTLSHNANAIAVCAWVNHDEFISGQVERYVTVGSEVAVIRKENDGRLHFYIQTGGSLRHLWVSDVLTKGQWHCVAGAWDGLTQRLYLDGVLTAWQRPGGVLGTASSVNVSSSAEPFNGMLDDVRVYNYALTHGEILSLAGLSTLYVPVPSSAEIYEGEAQGSRVINFKDYAELMDSWLVEVKYPR